MMAVWKIRPLWPQSLKTRKNLKELHVTSIDVEKTFPSISHYAIVKALERKGFTRDFRIFIENMYSRSTTFLEIGDELGLFIKNWNAESFGCIREVRTGERPSFE